MDLPRLSFRLFPQELRGFDLCFLRPTQHVGLLTHWYMLTYTQRAMHNARRISKFTPQRREGVSGQGRAIACRKAASDAASLLNDMTVTTTLPFLN